MDIKLSLNVGKNNKNGDKYTFISEESKDVLNYKWYIAAMGTYKKLYVVRKATKEEISLGYPTTIRLHRQILGIHTRNANKFEEVDHLNQDTLDNRLENLQLKTTHGNSRNRKNSTKVGKGLWGTHYRKDKKNMKNPWEASFGLRINKKLKRFHAGCYSTEKEAHEAAVKRYKEITGSLPVIG